MKGTLRIGAVIDDSWSIFNESQRDVFRGRRYIALL